MVRCLLMLLPATFLAACGCVPHQLLDPAAQEPGLATVPSSPLADSPPADAVTYAVDINRRRHGTFIAGTGQPIVGPESLADHPPHTLIVMSPIYLPEIQAELARRNLHPNSLLSVETPDQLSAA